MFLSKKHLDIWILWIENIKIDIKSCSMLWVSTNSNCMHTKLMVLSAITDNMMAILASLQIKHRIIDSTPTIFIAYKLSAQIGFINVL